MTKFRSPRLTSLFERENERVWRVFRRLGFSDSRAVRLTCEAFQIAAAQLDRSNSAADCKLLMQTVVDLARAARREMLELSMGASPRGGREVAAEGAHGATCVLDAILARLSIDSALVFVLFELEGVAISEIAAALRVGEAEARLCVRGARESYRAAMRCRLDANRGQLTLALTALRTE